ncbi:MAG: PIG-L family deacetylase [Candidatus Bipolaricaulota bacterium]
MRGLALVAHFDDAPIWVGGAIWGTLQLGWEWLVVTTSAAEPQRRGYIDAWCASLGVRSVALSFCDHPDGAPFSRNARDELLLCVREAVQGFRPDWVFAHNPDSLGEYGPHPNHLEAAEAARELAHQGLWKADRLALFAYQRASGTAAPPVARSGATHILPLDYPTLQRKAAWCASANDVERADPELGENTWLRHLGWPCPNPEAFSAHDLPPPFLRRAR